MTQKGCRPSLRRVVYERVSAQQHKLRHALCASCISLAVWFEHAPLPQQPGSLRVATAVASYY